MSILSETIANVRIHGRRRPSTVTQKLEKLGFRLAGSGEYSEVYASPNNEYVVKVTTSEDTCWDRYAEWITKFPASNVSVPRILKISKFKNGESELTATFMEFLEPVDGLPYGMKEYADLIKGYEIDIDKQLARDFEVGNPELAALLVDIAEYMPECNIDIHRGNLMRRPKTGDLVLTDPVN